MVKILNKGFKTARSRYAFRLNRNPPPLPEPRPTQLARAGKAETVSAALVSSAQAATRVPAATPIPPAHAALDRLRVGKPAHRHEEEDLRLGIQVGAYTSSTPAKRILRTVRQHSGPAGGGPDLVQSVRKEAGTIFRARIVGLDEIAARTACAELVARHLPCVAVPNATGLEVAEAGES